MNIYEVTDLSSGKVEYVSASYLDNLRDYYSEVKVVSLDPSEKIQVAYYKEGELHRLDGPAIVEADGSKEWCKDGKPHRLDGPAIINSNGNKHWYKDGMHHRLDGPAVTYADGNEYWYKDGLLHRLDGPAIVYADGPKYWTIKGTRRHVGGRLWYIEGNRYSEKEFNEYLRSH